MKKRPLAPTAAATLAAGALLTGVSGCGHSTTAGSAAGQPASHVSPGRSIGPGGPMQMPTGGPKTSKQPINQPVTLAAQDRTVTAKAVVGGCRTAKLVSQETLTAVTLTVVVTNNQKPGEMCSTLAKIVPVQTTLKAPLDSRKLIDGATGKQLPAPK
ncbi:hypothetical protein NGB36_24880 [Streptomyces sp. RB6PN25]|uniref:Lipoprotein n=1 Tax=Streptomyces humicola TaxID=2953240 RepID=A0ABT1Q1G9_9ACTN|nr:hypothetical protein [Streptomyces humicola]MCQ4083739.1 hypothetical protein [Streptomyces humicola]